MIYHYFISIGSNIEPEKNIPRCLKLLKEIFTVKRVSSIYQTDPVGPAGDKKFWNLALEIGTNADRKATDRQLKEIETKLGRSRSQGNKFAPRTIDIDLLPQPDYQKQGFIMIPLAEIAGDEKDPETGRIFKAIAADLSSKASVQKVSGTYT